MGALFTGPWPPPPLVVATVASTLAGITAGCGGTCAGSTFTAATRHTHRVLVGTRRYGPTPGEHLIPRRNVRPEANLYPRLGCRYGSSPLPPRGTGLGRRFSGYVGYEAKAAVLARPNRLTRVIAATIPKCRALPLATVLSHRRSDMLSFMASACAASTPSQPCRACRWRVAGGWTARGREWRESRDKAPRQSRRFRQFDLRR